MRTMLRSSRTFNLIFSIAIIAIFTLAFIVGSSAYGKSTSPGDPAATYSPLLKAIRTVESNDNPGAVGDNGQALGAYQIHQTYWIDANMGGKYANVTDRNYATRCVVLYWRRHCPDALERGDLKTLAMTHHSGPSARFDADYWRKIERALSEQS